MSAPFDPPSPSAVPARPAQPLPSEREESRGAPFAPPPAISAHPSATAEATFTRTRGTAGPATPLWVPAPLTVRPEPPRASAPADRVFPNPVPFVVTPDALAPRVFPAVASVTGGSTPLPNGASPAARHLLPIAAAGAAVAIALGVYGRVHEPTGGSIVDLGFPSMRAMKAWFATGAIALVVVQIASALAMFGRLPGLRRVPAWVPFAHRWSGTAAFVLTLPAAYHCLWALGFQTSSARVVAHSLFGCAFYGAMTTKLLGLRSDRLPRWAIPLLGSLLVVTLTGVWLTSALWFFTAVDFPALPG